MRSGGSHLTRQAVNPHWPKGGGVACGDEQFQCSICNPPIITLLRYCESDEERRWWPETKPEHEDLAPSRRTTHPQATLLRISPGHCAHWIYNTQVQPPCDPLKRARNVRQVCGFRPLQSHLSHVGRQQTSVPARFQSRLASVIEHPCPVSPPGR